MNQELIDKVKMEKSGDDQLSRCYDEECDYDADDLGDDAWLTGCPLCGSDCWLRDKEHKERVDRELDAE